MGTPCNKQERPWSPPRHVQSKLISLDVQPSLISHAAQVTGAPKALKGHFEGAPWMLPNATPVRVLTLNRWPLRDWASLSMQLGDRTAGWSSLRPLVRSDPFFPTATVRYVAGSRETGGLTPFFGSLRNRGPKHTKSQAKGVSQSQARGVSQKPGQKVSRCHVCCHNARMSRHDTVARPFSVWLPGARR